MLSELQNFFQQISLGAKRGEKRDLTQDLKLLLSTLNIKYETKIAQKKLSDKPTIVLSNHYTRSLISRGSFFTTLDSMITSAIIAQEVSKLSKRKITATVKNDLKTNMLFLSIKTRKIQLAAIDTYDLIGISKNYPFGDKPKWAKAIRDGKNVIAYPEGVVSRKLTKFKPELLTLLEHLKSQKLSFQVLPVSIYTSKKDYKVNIGKPIDGKYEPEEIIKYLVHDIASDLPKNIRGYYESVI